jgi:hypothetical protein
MQTELPLPARQDDGRAVDPWAFMVGGSAGIVIGFGIDLSRLGIHKAKQALAARAVSQHSASGGWPCRDTCDAGSR